MTPAPPRLPGAGRQLHELARCHGVQVAHTDHRGRRRRAGDQAVVAVLRALGVPIEGPGDAAELLRARSGMAGRVIEPVLVRRSGARGLHVASLPATVDPAAVRLTVHREDGGVTRTPLAALLRPAGPRQPVAPGGVEGGWAVGGGQVEHRFRLPRLPDGYHRLTLEAPGVEASALVVAAPARCPQPDRGWGVLAPLHAVRTTVDWGVGSYGDLARMGDWVTGLGGSLVGFLPVLAAFLEGPSADPSPYRPASRVAWSELYIDVETLPELGTCPPARRLLASSPLCRERDRLRCAGLADPVATMAAKRRVLELLSAAIFAGGSARRTELEAFVAACPQVLPYARFRAAAEAAGGVPPAPEGQGRGRGDLPADDDPLVRYHLYVQWVADAQLAAAAGRSGLYLDLPVGVHPGGFDPWWWPRAFVPGVSVGAPPDDFFSAGQSWGCSPPHPEGSREEGYGYLVAVLRHTMRHAAVVRLDHVMGLHRLWFVPDGMDPAEGVYVRYRDDEVRAVAVLEAARAGVAVVGEDLGTVPDRVRRCMRRDGMLRSHVYQFAATPEDPFPDAPADSAASLGTHDLPPFAAWWEGGDIDDRQERGFTPPEVAEEERRSRAALRRSVTEASTRARPAGGSQLRPFPATRALRTCLAHLASGPARLLLVDLADLWGERRPQNRPGTGAQEANFLRRWAWIWPDDLVPAGSVPSRMLRLVDRARGGDPGTGDASTEVERT